jgi:pyruvate,orthophosphate dikinase
MHLDKERETLTCRREAVTFHRDDLITLDGYAGIIYKGDIPTRCYIEDVNFLRILRWADHFKRMLVKGIVHDEEDLHAADLLDADGILVARTEPYMPQPEMVREVFISPSRLGGDTARFVITRMERKCQRLVEIFRMFGGRRVTFRLSYQPNLAQLFSAELLGNSKIKHYPPGYTTSPVEAIVTGVVEARRQGIIVTPTILIPDYHQDQMEAITTLIRKTFSDVAYTHPANIRSIDANSVEVGVMVESVRGCLVADSLVVAGSVYMDCVCFCADHITESFFGDTMSAMRPAPKAMQHRHTILTKKPYADLETQTVGDLIRQSIQKCLRVNPSIMVIVTGERCGDLSSVQYINWLSANTIACPASLVPVVKIAAAQAQIKKMEGGDLGSEDHQN